MHDASLHRRRNVKLEEKTREQTWRRKRRRNSPQREGELQLLSNLGTEGEEPGGRQVRGRQVDQKQHQPSVLNVQKLSNTIHMEHH